MPKVQFVCQGINDSWGVKMCISKSNYKIHITRRILLTMGLSKSIFRIVCDGNSKVVWLIVWANCKDHIKKIQFHRFLKKNSKFYILFEYILIQQFWQ